MGSQPCPEVRGIKVPLVPVLVGTVALPFAAYFGGSESLAFALVATVVAILLWRAIDTAEDAVRSIFAGIFVVLWVPFLLSFALLLLGEPTARSALRCCCSWWSPMTPWVPGGRHLRQTSHGTEDQSEEVLEGFAGSAAAPQWWESLRRSFSWTSRGGLAWCLPWPRLPQQQPATSRSP
ncbi:hypothetical protein GCM10017708_39180 [Arthrobacter citreus]